MYLWKISDDEEKLASYGSGQAAVANAAYIQSFGILRVTRPTGS